MNYGFDTEGALPSCSAEHVCAGHAPSHRHGRECGHEMFEHDDHLDFIVDGHLHSPCGTHCDDHGRLN